MKAIAVVAAVLGFAAAVPACAAGYPDKPIKMLVGFLPGGGTDVTARLLATKLSEKLGQSVIVENRPGAGGMIATAAVARSAPDGYTMLMASAADAAQHLMHKDLSYDLLKDFAPVSLVVTVPFALAAKPTLPVNDVAELVELARAHPGELRYASSGMGSAAHLSNELFNTMAKVRIVHIPYKGVAEGVTAVASNQIDMVFASFPSVMALAAARKVKLLAVSTPYRTAVMPDLPTVAESGLPGYARYGWYGVVMPRNVPSDVVDRMNAAIVSVVGAPDVREAFIKQGLEPKSTTRQEFAGFLKDEVEQATELARASGLEAAR
ncbi:tripartite tricarboxylate transporter substrate binding protein [Pigmentiphaga kullae]|uniref:Tripartite-type tricarboxylate transporter receptor subunit TctC n=1 Tax=Pigmentiphaga kullae TaxID=151784 RepID=A0A4Q7N7W4_9BURK|nr:tripartite tricarboxylate transporter substrate binding protein [Pigmentiphaga kullae]RZS78044.1 tripartite-type tricarboxylate transporter receptor subunit TctC [Pigmentiphaga kullae]